MTDPFQMAWMMLKAGGYRTEENPHDTRAHNDARIARHDEAHGAPIPQPSNDGQRLIDMLANEENSYGDTSYREHPLHGEEGYEENTRGGRGHSLDLRDMDIEGNPFNQGDDSAVNRLMDERQNMVDEQGEHLRQFNHQGEGHGLRGGNEPVQDYRGATDRYRHESEAQDARARLIDRMYNNEASQDAYGDDIERQIGQDEQRLGQQPEADEMEDMGVEPIGRQLGGKPPANIGQAGSTGGADPERYSINPFAMGEAMNTFRPTQEIKDWSQTHAPGPASAVGQAKHGHDDRSAMEAMEAWDESAEHAPLQSNESFGNEQAGTLTDTPRHEKRGQEGAGRAFDRPGFRSGEHMPLQDRRQ